jgi:hypothetical protein
MPLQDYTELQKLIGDTLARDDLDSNIPDWIFMAELEAQRELDMPMTEKMVKGTLVADRGYIELPNDFVEGRLVKILSDPVREIRIAGTSDLTVVDAGNGQGSTRHPLVGTYSGSRLYVEPKSQADDYELWYYAGIEHLGDGDRKTNYLLRVGGDYLLYTAMLHSAPYLGADDRIQTWLLFQGRAEASMRRQVFRSRTGGGPLHMRSDRGHP